VELKKALYGTLKAALLFWKKLTMKLKQWGFEVNPYDWCVMNKTIDGTQCTTLWHVDDLKISHAKPNVVTKVIKQLEAEFGIETPLAKTCGKVHEYLSMILDFTTPGKVMVVSMKDFIERMINELPTDIDGEAVTAAANHLFEVNETDPIKLTRNNPQCFIITWPSCCFYVNVPARIFRLQWPFYVHVLRLLTPMITKN